MPIGGRKPLARVGPPAPLRGTIRNVYVDEWKLVAGIRRGRPAAGNRGETQGSDLHQRQGKAVSRDLQPDDQASIKNLRDEYGFLIQEIQATRPELHRGVIVCASSPTKASSPQVDRR